MLSKEASLAVVPPAPSQTLAQRAPDLLVWGAVIVLLMISFGPVEINRLPMLFSNSITRGCVVVFVRGGCAADEDLLACWLVIMVKLWLAAGWLLVDSWLVSWLRPVMLT